MAESNFDEAVDKVLFIKNIMEKDKTEEQPPVNVILSIPSYNENIGNVFY